MRESGLSGAKKQNDRTGRSASSSCRPTPVNALSSGTNAIDTSRSPRAPRILKSRSGTDVSVPWSTAAGDDGSSNSMPVKGNLRMMRRSSTVHWPWIGRDDVDIGIRMYIVAKPSNLVVIVVRFLAQSPRPCSALTSSSLPTNKAQYTPPTPTRRNYRVD